VESVVLMMSQHRRQSVAISAAIVLGMALWPARVDAHLNSTGLGPVYDGAVHLLLSPEDLVPAVALALLAGLRGAGYGRSTLFALPAAWVSGGLAGMAAGHASGGVVAVVSFVLLGTLVAMDARLSVRILTALAIAFGLVHGFVNGAGMGPFDVGMQALIGLAAVLFVLTALVVAFVVQLRQPWSRIAVRALGSWIAASGLLLLGWVMHTTR
jgi:urease accessory protein